MNLKVKKTKFMKQEALDKIVDLYLHKRITHETFIDCIIQGQKRLIVNELIGANYGKVAGEVFLRRMDNAGVEIVI